MTTRFNLTALGILVALLLTGATGASGQAVTRSPHRQIPEGLACTACHTAEAWSPLRPDLEFDHAGATGFALDGQHGELSCQSCHADLTFDEIESDRSDCASCHLDVHLGTPTRPCASCHTTESFRQLPDGIVHPADFPLEGAHLQTSCESCHSDDLGGAFSPPDRECWSCHMGDYYSSVLVDHEALGFSTYCLDCHSTLDFRDVAFDHFTISGGFELIGRHAGIECTSCHSLPDGGLPVTPAGPDDCIACHLDDYQHEHGGSGFPTNCLACHDTFSWEGGEFDHLAATGFQLLQGHDQLPCVACHVGSSSETVFSPSGPQDCYACHQDDYQREHGGTGFSTDCASCHQPTSWGAASFNHPFPISSGAHSTANCSDCHSVPGDYVTFTCTSACHHTQSRTDGQHGGVGNYSYDSQSCLSGHPTGRRD